MTPMKQQRIYSLFAAVLTGSGMIGVASAGETVRTSIVAVADRDSQDLDKAAIYSILVDYCRYSLETTSNDLARCQLYAQWGRALEQKLRLQKMDFPSIRRAVVVPYIAGYQAATEHQFVGVNDSKVTDTSTETKGRKEHLTEYRLFFKQQIVALYSQPPVDFAELELLVSRIVTDKSTAREIIEADEFKSLRARNH